MIWCALLIVSTVITERARSPPLIHQDELECCSDEENSIEADERVVGEFTATGEYFPGT